MCEQVRSRSKHSNGVEARILSYLTIPVCGVHVHVCSASAKSVFGLVSDDVG